MGSWVPLQPAVYFTESTEFTRWKVTAPCQAAVKHRGNMPITEKEKIFPDTIHGKRRIMLHHLEIQGSKIVCATQGTTRMTALNGMHHAYNIPSYLGSYFSKVIHIVDVIMAKFCNLPANLI